MARLAAFRAARSGEWQRALDALANAARGTDNLMPFIVDAVRHECTVGEIVNAMKETFGEHREQGF